MKFTLVVAVAAMLFCTLSCTSDRAMNAVEPTTPVHTFSSINLQEGVSKWLTLEQKARFPDGELAELDALVSNNILPVATSRSSAIVRVPANSSDALARAIAEVGVGGTVILEAGDHFESSTVNIQQSVTIRGEAGAVLISDVQATSQVVILEAAIHIQNAYNVVIIGVSFKPSAEVGGTGILVDNAERTFLVNNTLNDFEFGIVLEQGNRARIINNEVNTTSAWTTGFVPFAHGLMIINGDDTRVIGNTFTNSFFGAWTCDESGLNLGNTTTGNFAGNVLCNVPAGAFTMPSGQTVGSAKPGTNWLTIANKSFGNSNTGYLIIDGAADNYLSGNEAGDNGAYDFEFTGESQRFGFPMPTSSGNQAIIGGEYTVKDCGMENVITGGMAIDLIADPCF
ncbi:MAG: right-handed parallel beta-helix repeat-containing protein [Bacteroidota bacterium]